MDGLVGGVRRWVQGQPWWLHLAVAAGLAAALLVAAQAALPPGWSLAPGIAPGAIVAIPAFWKERQFWRLPRDDRLAVIDATRSGYGTGRPALDQVARARLIRRAGSFRWDRVILPVVLVAVVAVPVAAAVRAGDAWWIAVELPVLLAMDVLDGFAFQDPRPALASLSKIAS